MCGADRPRTPSEYERREWVYAKQIAQYPIRTFDSRFHVGHGGVRQGTKSEFRRVGRHRGIHGFHQRRHPAPPPTAPRPRDRARLRRGKTRETPAGKTTAKPNTKTTKKRLPNVVPTVSQPIITDPLKVNLKGATIKVYTSYPKDQIGVFNTQKGKSQTGNAYADRLTKIQDTIKCKVQVTVVPADQMVSAAFAAVASGESYGHIMEAPIYNAVSYISSGLATNLRTVPDHGILRKAISTAGRRSRPPPSVRASGSWGPRTCIRLCWGISSTNAS